MEHKGELVRALVKMKNLLHPIHGGILSSSMNKMQKRLFAPTTWLLKLTKGFKLGPNLAQIRVNSVQTILKNKSLTWPWQITNFRLDENLVSMWWDGVKTSAHHKSSWIWSILRSSEFHKNVILKKKSKWMRALEVVWTLFKRWKWRNFNVDNCKRSKCLRSRWETDLRLGELWLFKG